MKAKVLSNVLSLIENNFENIVLKEKVTDLFMISSIFNPYLNKPNFLFKKILENKAHIMVNKENSKIILEFVNGLLKKFEKKYTFFSFLNIGAEDYVDTIGIDTIQIMAILLKKFKALNSSIFNILSIDILLFEEFRTGCFENLEEKKGYKNFFC